jgi:hypothetical protein
VLELEEEAEEDNVLELEEAVDEADEYVEEEADNETLNELRLDELVTLELMGLEELETVELGTWVDDELEMGSLIIFPPQTLEFGFGAPIEDFK